MKLNYTPVHWRTGEPLTDEMFEFMLANYWDGYAILFGTQTVHAPDPRNDPRDMAVFLFSHGYSLSDELSALLPDIEPIPDDAIA